MSELETFDPQDDDLKYASESWDPDWYKTNIPCQVGCPAHTDVSTYIGLISQGRFDEAYLLNRNANVVPACWGAPARGPASRFAAATKLMASPSPSAG
jgi:hypothetical protein